jgi:CRP-like cAMP-binding protein
MTQGAAGDEVILISDGLVEVTVGEHGQGDLPPHTVVNLGGGQLVGEMSLVDHGPRSASVRCITETCSAFVIERDAFEQLCAANHRIGMVVYRNLAADMSFKLRHRHLTRR